MWRHDVTTWRHVTSRRHHMTSHDVVTSLWWQIFTHMKSLHLTTVVNDSGMIFIWRPWPLTYDIYHSTSPRYRKGTPPHQIWAPYIKQVSCQSAHRHTDTQIDRQMRLILLPRLLSILGTVVISFGFFLRSNYCPIVTCEKILVVMGSTNCKAHF